MREDKIPPSWTWARLGDLGEWKGGGTPSKSNASYWQNGTIPWVSAKDMKTFAIRGAEDLITEEALQNSAATRLPVGSLLMVTRSGILQHTFPVAVTRAEVAINQDLKALIPHAGVLPDYLAFSLRCYEQSILHSCSKDGTTVQSIETEALREFRIPFAPSGEQARIVAEIEKQFTRLDDAVVALKRVQANLKRYRASVLKAACEGRLVPTEAELARKEGRDYEPASELLKRILAERRAKWESDQLAKMIVAGKPPKDNEWKKKFKEPEPPDESGLPKLPEGWLWATVDQIGEVQGGIQKQPKRVPKDNAYPYLRVANVYRGELDLSQIEYMELFGNEIDTLRLETGDLLIVEGNGSPNEIGRMAIWRGEIENCVHQNHIIRVRLTSGIEPEFCMAYWNSPDGSRRVMNVASSTSGLHTLSVSKIQRLVIPIAPVGEQQRLIAEMNRRLSVLQHDESAIFAQLEKAQRLRAAILHDAFSGKLVPQDPSDEPASVLLERIRAERAQQAASKPARKPRTKREKAIAVEA